MRVLAVLSVFGLWAATTGIAHAAVFYPSHFTLSNGLEVVVVSNRMAPVVSQMVWYKVGSVDEPAGKSGLAHYLEHLMFRGTETIGPGEFSRIVAAQGGSNNAFTTRDYTAYYEEVAADRLPMIMQMEADRMKNLRIVEETAAPELRVILGERQERTDNSPVGLFLEKFTSAFIPHHPYGRPVIGWKKEIEKLSVSDVRRFYEEYYAPNNAVVIVSGDIKVEDVMSLAAATYGRVPRKAIPQRSKIPAVPQTQSRNFVYEDSRIEQPQVVWRFVAPSYATQTEGEAYAYEVLSETLHAGEVGLLYRKLVTELGLASGVRVSYDPDARGEAIFSIAAALRPGKKYEDLQNAMQAALNDCVSKGLDGKSVEAAKRRLLRAAIFAREGLSTPGYAFGMALTTGHRVSDVEEWPERIGAVTLDQTNVALKSLISSKRQLKGAMLPQTRKAGHRKQKAHKKAGAVRP